jgi:hypothetical protein
MLPDRRLLLACITSSVLGILLSAFIHSSWSSINLYSDISSFWQRAWVSAGQFPYSPSHDVFEYPVVSGLILYASGFIGGAISGLAGGLYAGYYVGFTAFSLAAAALLGWSTWRLAKALGADLNPLYFMMPTTLIYGIYNFDLFNALFMVLSLQFFVEKRRDLSAGFLGVALATKFVGGVLLPVYFLELHDRRDRWRYLAVSLLVAAVLLVPIAIYNTGYYGQFLGFYRGWGLEDAWYIWIFQDQFSSAAKVFGILVMAVLLVRVYTLKVPVLQKSFLALAAYLLGTYIYAPQFNLMLLPLLAVMAVSSPWFYLLETFNALIILTWFTVPDPTHVGTVPQAFALLRSASLALLSLSVASGTGHSMGNWVRNKVHWESSRPAPHSAGPEGVNHQPA